MKKNVIVDKQLLRTEPSRLKDGQEILIGFPPRISRGRILKTETPPLKDGRQVLDGKPDAKARKKILNEG